MSDDVPTGDGSRDPGPGTDVDEATDVDTTAGFAYHLRQLTDAFVRKVPASDAAADGDDAASDQGSTADADEPDRYELTDAGRRVARAVAAGTYTASVDTEPVALDDDCPICGDPEGLHATVADNVTRVGCDACERDVLALPFPPSGYATRDPERVPDAVDRHHRRRIASFADGVCPDCGGSATGHVEPVDEDDRNGVAGTDTSADADTDEPLGVRARFACEACTATLACPVSLALLDHPAVVAAYHDHGVDVRERALWTVGVDWRERVLSTDPWCVRATLRDPTDDDPDGGPRDVLAAYVGRDLTVVDTDRLDAAGASAADAAADDGAITADAEDADATDDAPADDGTPA
ncbi:DUF7351 domain-containing protein [Halorubellus litoreus]|uniref:ArsR family transcriptional regulator n=1 Tax=Halorubellus litoreus TaxID=755308 RepID=A0ABD5VD97_9EURY